MWTVFIVTFTASIITLKSMHGLKVHGQKKQNSSEPLIYRDYLVSEAESLPFIVQHLLKQLPQHQVQITLEIIFMWGQVEFVISIPSIITLDEPLQSKLIPINPLWEAVNSNEVIIDDSENILAPILAHQIILKSKTKELIYMTTRMVKRKPENYITSGIDSYKWNQFTQKVVDYNPDLITGDRVYTLIQEKLSL